MRAWREARGISLDKMVELVGLSKPSLSRIENNITPYYQDVLEVYAEVLQCSTGDLLMRAPTAPESLWEVWDKIREDSRPQALAVLRALGTEKS